MAINTYKVTLKYGTAVPTATTTHTKLVDIKDFPDLGGAPDALEVTTLSDSSQVYIPGIKKQSSFEFTANYDETTYDTIASLTSAGTKYFSIDFGADSLQGSFYFQGYAYVYVVGAGVNSVVEMKVVIVPTSAITRVSPGYTA